MNKQSFKDIWHTIKHTDIRIREVLKGVEREETTKKQFRWLIVENFPNWRKNINLHIQETQWIPSRIYTKRSTLRILLGDRNLL